MIGRCERPAEGLLFVLNPGAGWMSVSGRAEILKYRARQPEPECAAIFQASMRIEKWALA